MRKLSLSLFFVTSILLINSCKKEVVEPQPLVQKQILGRWPFKYTVRTVYVDNVEMWPATFTYTPIDTLLFRTDGKVITRRNGVAIDSTTYSIDATGEHITFGTSAPRKLSFVRFKSIGIISETTVKNGTSTIRTVIEDQLVK